jgi:indoleamine 2,3-dioxygenase
MVQNCWTVRKETGFLLNPDPIADLRLVDVPLADGAVAALEGVAGEMPAFIHTRQLRPTLQKLPTFDMTPLHEITDFRVVERLFQVYAHFANGFIWCENDNPMTFLPAGVAVPLVALAKMVERPPIIPYATTALANYQRIDPAGDIVVDNLRVVQKMIDIPDESWFHLIHVEIEAHAGSAIHACLLVTAALKNGDLASAEHALADIPPALQRMITTFKRMPQGCNPNTYYHTLRPYLFGFDNIVYEGVAEYGGKPQTITGETGAQSSVIPALITYLGLTHEQGGLTEHMELMKAFMPKPHRELIAGIDTKLIRQTIATKGNPSLRAVYNACLEKVVEFRTLHLHFAHAFIASKVADPKGTGGTDFMRWLKQLRDETEQQYL